VNLSTRVSLGDLRPRRWSANITRETFDSRASTRAEAFQSAECATEAVCAPRNLAVGTRVVNAVTFCNIGEIKSSTTLIVGGANEFAKRYPS
jgi:sensor c-di-GMP phosphodiesterase-like protein